MPLFGPLISVPTAAYTLTNPMTQRTLDVSGATLTDLKNVLGTLIADGKTAKING